MKLTEKAAANNEGVSQITELTRELLEQFKLKKKHAARIVLAVEEAAGGLAAHSHEDSIMSVSYRFFMGVLTIELSAPGEQFDLQDTMNADLMSDELGEGSQEVIGKILLKSLADDLKYQYRKGVNWICFTILRSPRAFLYQTMGQCYWGSS